MTSHAIRCQALIRMKIQREKWVAFYAGKKAVWARYEALMNAHAVSEKKKRKAYIREIRAQILKEKRLQAERIKAAKKTESKLKSADKRAMDGGQHPTIKMKNSYTSTDENIMELEEGQDSGIQKHFFLLK